MVDVEEARPAQTVTDAEPGDRQGLGAGSTNGPRADSPPGAQRVDAVLERRLVDQLPPQRPHRAIGERRLRRDELADDTLGVGETSRAAQGVPRSRSASGSDLSLRSVCVSIWRMRSRVTPNARPTSSSVRGSSPSRP
jgi:hypothetical protein